VDGDVRRGDPACGQTCLVVRGRRGGRRSAGRGRSRDRQDKRLVAEAVHLDLGLVQSPLELVALERKRDRRSRRRPQ
jgi:hypothetical protein